MNLSIWLLAASYAAGGPVDAPAYAPSASIQPQVINSAPCNCSSSAPASAPAPHRFGILSGLRNRIHQRFHADEDTSYVPVSQGIYHPVPIPTPAPVPTTPTTAEPPAMNGLQPVSSEKLDLKVRKEFQNKIGAAEDYSWITGQLFYIHADGGRWVLRYAGVDQEDKYGGSVVLQSAADMRNFREGDLVSVNGEVLTDNRASKHLGGPLYRVTSINMIERAD